jgi:hypothetical protein
MPQQPNLTNEELATILHALRALHCGGRLQGCAIGDCDHFENVEPLSNNAIDGLCERLNFDGCGLAVMDSLKSIRWKLNDAAFVTGVMLNIASVLSMRYLYKRFGCGAGRSNFK